ncbi:TraB/GumN family protein [Caulobacter sp.]|uniref:TraB/GumN family protein n=1 Tax=Caulobacter sp. TaxID=78 RepID=UPI00160C247E
MTPTRFAAAGLALSLLLAGSAQAQAPVELTRVDPNANLVEELIVNARLPGPAWWKVSDADTTVYVLGVPAMVPSSTRADESVLRRRLDGANVLIMGQEADVGVLRLVALAMGGRKLFVMDKPMRQTLPADLRERLEARLKVMKERPEAMDDVKPAFAGFLVANSQDGSVSISVGGVTERIRDIAKSRDLKQRPRIQNLPDYSLVDAIKALAGAPKPLQELCLDAGLRQAESGQGGVKAMAQRWAEGQVRDVVAADRGFQRCLDSTPSIARELREGRDDAVDAIAKALKTPGKAVAVIELRSLLAQDGVLDRLRAQGFTVTAPE